MSGGEKKSLANQTKDHWFGVTISRGSRQSHITHAFSSPRPRYSILDNHTETSWTEFERFVAQVTRPPEVIRSFDKSSSVSFQKSFFKNVYACPRNATILSQTFSKWNRREIRRRSWSQRFLFKFSGWFEIIRWFQFERRKELERITLENPLTASIYFRERYSARLRFHV